MQIFSHFFCIFLKFCILFITIGAKDKQKTADLLRLAVPQIGITSIARIILPLSPKRSGFLLAFRGFAFVGLELLKVPVQELHDVRQQAVLLVVLGFHRIEALVDALCEV